MPRGWLAFLLMIAGLLLIGVGLGGDPCDREDAAATAVIILGGLSLGAAAFFVVQARSRRTWIAVTATVATTVAAVVGSGIIAVIQWGETCAS
jgi:hypothetical protein